MTGTGRVVHAAAAVVVIVGLGLVTGSCGPSAGPGAGAATVVPADAVVSAPEPDEPDEPDEPASSAEGEEAETDAVPPQEPAPAISEVSAPVDRTPDDWSPTLPWVDDERLRLVHVERSDAGDVRVAWDAPTEAIEQTTARLLEGLHAAGYEDVRACEPSRDGGRSCAAAREDRRVLVRGWPVIGDPERARVVVHHLPAGHRVREGLPGPCVTPPERARTIVIETAPTGRRRSRSSAALESRDTGPVYGANTWNGPDLDGDGVGEVFVPQLGEEACPWEIPYDVYVMRGTCGHRVGTVIGHFGDEVELAPFAKGLRTIRTSAEWSDRSGSSKVPMHITLSRRYAFDGRKYRKGKTRRERGKCHHCSVLLQCRWGG